MTTSLTISAIMNDALANAIDKGFRHNGPERSFGEEVALFHSEVTEALEDWRDGQHLNETVYRFGGKPDGVPSEMADIIIRVCEICAFHKLDLNAELAGRSPIMVTLDDLTKGSFDNRFGDRSFGDSLSDLHNCFSKAYENWMMMRRPDPMTSEHGGVLSCLGNAVKLVCALSKFHNIDIEKAVREKMAFNKGRPFRHGGKKI